ncbi:hypothetical protein, partial [Pseudomonas aeruginosa]|uniref:hypothetical protein n=1 Tax=Pseudomonas aeruginosa TaxID=287 RepID=UPI0037482AF7
MSSLLLAIFAISLTACSVNAPESNKKPQTVTVQVLIGKKSADYKVTPNSTLLALTQKKLHANVTKGFINSIDGMSSNPKADCY